MLYMVRRLGIVFIIIFVLGFFNYLWAQASKAFSGGSFAIALMPASPMSGSSKSLSSIDFNLFSKDGKGWGYVTQGYGRTPYSAWYVDGWHNGIDIAAQYGAPVYASRDGVVIATGNQDNYCPGRGFGKFVAVSDPTDDAVLWYAHLGTIAVSSGENVSKGSQIATIGQTGLETGPHLHISVFEASGFSIKNKNGCGPDADGRDVNPTPYLEKFSQ
jgi:murein DD-endopeptidase MepM/ murein hydrolase activator NlpD